MAKLTLLRFQCAEDTSEIGGESPYFITWVGNLDNPDASTIKLTALPYWNNNVDKGPGAWPVNEVVCNTLPPPSRALALAVMIEKDEGRDITSGERDDIKQKMIDALDTWVRAGVLDSSDATLVSTMKNTFEANVRTRLQSASGADDDLMEEDNWRAARRISLTSQPQELPIVTFKGGTGIYHVRYGVTA